MKPKLRNLILGIPIIFSGFNSINAQEREKIDSLLKAKLEKIAYVSGSSSWQKPKKTLERGAGNCADKSIYFSDILDSLGIENHLVRGEYVSEKIKGKHMWIEAPLDGKDYILECSGKGAIYDKDSLMNLENGPKYFYSNIDPKRRITDYIKDYYNETGKILDIKGFEPLGKVLPLLTSEKF